MTDKPFVLKLGVLDMPYGKDGEGITTHEVATILESKYGIMEYFYETDSEWIGNELLDSLEGAAESVINGASPSHDPYGPAMAEIESKFRETLMSRGFDGIPGVPTAAAERGYSKRFKAKGKKRPPRPSFIDTGLFEGSFRAWVGDDE